MPRSISIPLGVRAAIAGLVLDYLASGLDPLESVIFAHSAVPELNQLLLPFLSLVSVSERPAQPDRQGRDRRGRALHGE